MTREDDLIHEKIEGYHIAAELISNSFRSIFLGESISSTDPHQLVVIEFFYSVTAHTQQEQQDILQKISVLQQVDHSHILPILAAGFHNDILYIITEYLPSGSLYDRFQHKGQPLPTKEAILTLAQVGQALYYAHQRQLVHGSLSPQHVLFTTQNEAVVAGFHHHALLLPDEENAREEISIYRAPEQLPGQASEKGDQYALGCLAYALFTGSQAFTVPSVNTPGVYFKTKSLIAPGRMNSGLPLYIENAILKAMSREPDQRYPDIAAFLAALGIPSAGRKSELKETVALLAQIMQEGSTETPTAPELEIDTLETVKMLEVTATRDGKRANPDTFSLLPSDKALPFNTTLPAATDTHEKMQPPTRFPLAYAELGASSLRNIRKNFTTRPRRTSAVLLGLIAIMIICVTILVDLNFSLSGKKGATLPSIHKTSIATSSTQAGTTPTLRTPSSTIGITIPPRKPTPQHRIVPTTAPTPPPTTAPTVAPTAAPAQVLVALNSFFNNKGFGNVPGQADFDGSGYSYPASQFPSGGQISVQGVPYRFPYTDSGTNNNVVASGQTISLTPGKYRQAFVLAAASWGPVSGTVIIKYTDGSTSQRFVTVSDWYSNSGPLNATYRYAPNNIDNHPVCIYAIPISLDSTRIANALILPYQLSGPYQNGRIHIFALTVLS
jgi:serine/threonine protein kinase